MGQKVVIDVNTLYTEGDDAVAEVKDTFAKKNMDINVRQIKNGFLVRRSWTEPSSDENGRPYEDYKSEEEYYPENPL